MTRSILITGASGGLGRATALHLAEAEHAHLILLGRFGVPGYAAYCASKAGLIGLGKALALELVPKGILVNTVAPGWVDTEMASTGIRALGEALGVEAAEARREAERAVPLGRFFQPAEIARGIAFLLDPRNEMMVGKCLTLDGGSVQD